MLRPFSDRAKFHRTDLTTNRRFAAGPASVHHALEYVYFTSALHLIAQTARDNMIRRLAPMTAVRRARDSGLRSGGNVARRPQNLVPSGHISTFLRQSNTGQTFGC